MDDKYDISRDGATYTEDPEKYCTQIYAEAVSRNDELSSINVENRLFYEGIDKELEARRANPVVERSAIFVHQLKPAIDTRVSDSETALEEREFPVTGKSPLDVIPEELKQQIAGVERVINNQLRDCGYYTEVFHDHVLASEIYRTPSVVRVDWEDVYEKTPEVVPVSDEDIQRAALRGEPPPEPKVRWVNKYKGGRPTVQYIPSDQFLYQPNVADFYRDSEYTIQRDWVSWNRLYALAEEHDWDKSKIDKYRGEIHDPDSESEIGTSHQDKIEEERGTPFDEGYRDGKVLVCEYFICYYTDTGEERIDQVFRIGNKHIVKKNRTPYNGIKFPYVHLVANRMPGTIEGLSSVDVGKTMQRLYNETFNMFIDSESYRLFPPLLREAGTTINNTPVWGLGRIWDVTNAEGLRPLIDSQGNTAVNLPALMEAVAGKLRDTLNAHDVQQGFQASQYEKATSTKLRAFGASKRAMPVKKRHGLSVVRVAEMFLALNQQYHKDKIMFVVPIVLDCPSLTNITDPETDKRDTMLLLGQAMELPFYQSMLGQKKLLKLWRDVVSKFKKTSVNEFAHTVDELDAEQEQMMAMKQAMMAKETAAEQLAMNEQEIQSAEAELANTNRQQQ